MMSITNLRVPPTRVAPGGSSLRKKLKLEGRDGYSGVRRRMLDPSRILEAVLYVLGVSSSLFALQASAMCR